jgi:hypothetical protein
MILELMENSIAYDYDKTIEARDIHIQFLRLLYRRNSRHNFPLKYFFAVWINPFNSDKCTELLNANDGFVRQFGRDCLRLAHEGYAGEINLAKKEIRMKIYWLLIANRYWVERKVMEKDFGHTYRHVGPVYLARFLKKIGLDMRQDGSGRFDPEQLRKKRVMGNPQYSS